MALMTFDNAVEVLDEFLQKKPVHNPKDILQAMNSLCNDAVWKSNAEQNDFANICSNFDKYVQRTGQKSIGRKQFETWWEIGESINGTDLQKDPLPDIFGSTPEQHEQQKLDEAINKIFQYSQTVDNSPQAHKIKVENTELRNEVNRLKAELKAANDKLEAIWGIILWG
jgi:hypothetical protein